MYIDPDKVSGVPETVSALLLADSRRAMGVTGAPVDRGVDFTGKTSKIY
jgi:hypothetical protein